MSRGLRRGDHRLRRRLEERPTGAIGPIRLERGRAVPVVSVASTVSPSV
jgi:hypothetical protein